MQQIVKSELTSWMYCVPAKGYYHGITIIPAWINNHMTSNVWDKITYSFLSFECCIHQVLEQINISPQRYYAYDYLYMMGLK